MGESRCTSRRSASSGYLTSSREHSVLKRVASASSASSSITRVCLMQDRPLPLSWTNRQLANGSWLARSFHRQSGAQAQRLGYCNRPAVRFLFRPHSNPRAGTGVGRPVGGPGDIRPDGTGRLRHGRGCGQAQPPDRAGAAGRSPIAAPRSHRARHTGAERRSHSACALSSAPFDAPGGGSSTKRGMHSVMPDCGSGTPYTPPDWLLLTAPQVPGGVSPSAECRRSRSRVHMAFWPHSVRPVSTHCGH
jgi:hypothetical protein